jgi:hypothetical protein
MIRESLHSLTLKAVTYDPAETELIVESVEGTRFHYAPVPYGVYHAIAASRFPEKIYRHLITDHVLPPAVVELME